MNEPTALPKSTLFYLLAGLALLLVPAAVLMIGFYAPEEATLGIVQKIFYFHVPSAFMMYAGYGIAFVGSLGYLFSKKTSWDEYAAAGAEVGVIFATMVLVSGPLWARKSWGAYWTWDPQLTATFLVYLLFLSYLAVRSFAAEGERRRIISAIIAILATPNIAFIHWAVTVTHPKIIRNPNGSLAPTMVHTLLFCLLTITLLFAVIFWLRLHIERARNSVSRLKERVLLLEDRRAALLPVFLFAQDGFVTATGPTNEVSGVNLLVIAYAAMWAIVMLYVISLWKKQGKVLGEIKALRASLKDQEGDPR